MKTAYPQNLHTHSTFDDGHNPPEEMVLHAIERGFTSLGFSGHARTPFSTAYCLSPEKEVAYKKEILRLKEKYAGQIDIYLGFEMDYFAEADLTDYEYVIGSVHYFGTESEENGCDVNDPEILKRRINRYFDGDPYKLSQKYFELLADMPRKTGKMDIVGHFDLLLKTSEIFPIFDTSSPRYRDSANMAIESLIKQGKVFEINTGAIARGLKKVQYPETWALKRINELGGGVVISSDCHYKERLECYFKESLDLMKNCGFKEVLIFNGKGFDPIKIK